MLAYYTPEDLEILLEGVNLGTDISELVESLGRTESGIVQKLDKLSKTDPAIWDPEKVKPYVGHDNREKWKSVRNNPQTIARSQKRVLDYLRKHPDAMTPDLREAGLDPDLQLGYRHRINDARRELGLEERMGGGRLRLTREQRKEKILSYLRLNPDAGRKDAESAGHSYDFNEVRESIHSLRKEAGVVPEDYLLGAEAAGRLGLSKEGVSVLFRHGTLEGIRVGTNFYISRESVDNYSKNKLSLVST
jgi:excisionase family DNA binding protein